MFGETTFSALAFTASEKIRLLLAIKKGGTTVEYRPLQIFCKGFFVLIVRERIWIVKDTKKK